MRDQSVANERHRFLGPTGLSMQLTTREGWNNLTQLPPHRQTGAWWTPTTTWSSDRIRYLLFHASAPPHSCFGRADLRLGDLREWFLTVAQGYLSFPPPIILREVEQLLTLSGPPVSLTRVGRSSMHFEPNAGGLYRCIASPPYTLLIIRCSASFFINPTRTQARLSEVSQARLLLAIHTSLWKWMILENWVDQARNKHMIR